MFESLKVGGKVTVQYMSYLLLFDYNAYVLLNPENGYPFPEFLQKYVCVAMYGYVWLCVAVCIAMYGYVALYRVMSGYVWLCVAMYGYLGLCMSM